MEKNKDFMGMAVRIADNELRCAGGGSGIEFKTNEKTSLDVDGVFSLSGFKVTKSDVSPCDSFDAVGYMDGMVKVSVEKVLDVVENKDEYSSFFGDILLDNNEAYDIAVEVVSDLTEDDWALVNPKEDKITVYDLLEGLASYGVKKFEVGVQASFTYKDVRFGGYSRGKLGAGDKIISEVYDFDLDEVVIENVAVSTYDIDPKSIAPYYIGKKNFEYFWGDIFDSNDSIESMIKERILEDSDELDEKYADELADEAEEKGRKLTDEEFVEFIFEKKRDGYYESESQHHFDIAHEDWGV